MTRRWGLFLGIGRRCRGLWQGRRNFVVEPKADDFIPVGLGEEGVSRCEADEAEFVGGLVDILVPTEDFDPGLEVNDFLCSVGGGVLF